MNTKYLLLTAILLAGTIFQAQPQKPMSPAAAAAAAAGAASEGSTPATDAHPGTRTASPTSDTPNEQLPTERGLTPEITSLISWQNIRTDAQSLIAIMDEAIDAIVRQNGKDYTLEEYMIFASNGGVKKHTKNKTDYYFSFQDLLIVKLYKNGPIKYTDAEIKTICDGGNLGLIWALAFNIDPDLEEEQIDIILNTVERIQNYDATNDETNMVQELLYFRNFVAKNINQPSNITPDDIFTAIDYGLSREVKILLEARPELIHSKDSTSQLTPLQDALSQTLLPNVCAHSKLGFAETVLYLHAFQEKYDREQSQKQHINDHLRNLRTLQTEWEKTPEKILQQSLMAIDEARNRKKTENDFKAGYGSILRQQKARITEQEYMREEAILSQLQQQEKLAQEAQFYAKLQKLSEEEETAQRQNIMQEEAPARSLLDMIHQAHRMGRQVALNEEARRKLAQEEETQRKTIQRKAIMYPYEALGLIINAKRLSTTAKESVARQQLADAARNAQLKIEQAARTALFAQEEQTQRLKIMYPYEAIGLPIRAQRLSTTAKESVARQQLADAARNAQLEIKQAARTALFAQEQTQRLKIMQETAQAIVQTKNDTENAIALERFAEAMYPFKHVPGKYDYQGNSVMARADFAIRNKLEQEYKTLATLIQNSTNLTNDITTEMLESMLRFPDLISSCHKKGINLGNKKFEGLGHRVRTCLRMPNAAARSEAWRWAAKGNGI